MSIDKAKESAAIAAVNEQINNVGREVEDFFFVEQKHQYFRMFILLVLDQVQQLFQL